MCMSIASAIVSQTIYFVDENNSPIGGTTKILYYNIMNDGSVVFQSEETASSTQGVISYDTNLPIGVSKYLTYFLKDGFLPWVMVNDYHGEGSIEHTVEFTKAEYCHAPIREFSALNVNETDKPLMINVNAELTGSVYSAFSSNGLISYFPTDAKYIDYFSATTQVTIRIIDLSTNTEVHTDSITRDIFVDDSYNFLFNWNPTSKGTYKIIAESKVLDNQCNSATSYSEYDSIDSINVFRETDLRDTCFASIPSGIVLNPVEPTEGEKVIISGTKTGNYFLSENSVAEPVKTLIDLTVKDESGYTVYSTYKTLEKNSNPNIPEPFSFEWTPAKKGKYTLTLNVVSDDTRCTNINSEETHTLSFTVKDSPAGNLAPVINTINDRVQNINTIPTWEVDLWSQTNDDNTASNMLTYSLSETDRSVIECRIDANRYLRCAKPLTVGSSILTVGASDGSLTGYQSFTITVTSNDKNNTAPFWSNIPDRTVTVGSTPSWRIDLWNYAKDAETESKELTYTLDESNSSVIDCSLESNRYVTCSKGNMLGSSLITVKVFDGEFFSVETFKVTVSSTHSETEEEDLTLENNLYVANLRLISGERLYPGDLVRTSVQVENKGKDLDDIKVTAVIPELNIRDSVKFDLDKNDKMSRNLMLELPKNTPSGEYTIRYILRDANNAVYRIKHRTIEII